MPIFINVLPIVLISMIRIKLNVGQEFISNATTANVATMVSLRNADIDATSELSHVPPSLKQVFLFSFVDMKIVINGHHSML